MVAADGSDATRSGPVESAELEELVRERTEAIERLLELQAPWVEAVREELAATAPRSALEEDLRRLIYASEQARSDVADGQISWANAAATQHHHVDAWKAKHGESVRNALRVHAHHQPGLAVVMDAMFGDEPTKVHPYVELDDYLGLCFSWPVLEKVEPDTEVVRQGLGDPPSLDRCATRPFSAEFHQSWDGGIIYGTGDYLDKKYGVINLHSGGGYAFGAADLGLIGAEFVIPAGYSQFTITVDLDWDFEAWTIAVFGGAGCGVDLVIRVDKGDGSPPVDQRQWVLQLIAPVIWGNSVHKIGSGRMTMSFSTTDTSARTLGVLGGASTHAEAGGNAMARADGQVIVKEICVHAS